MWSLLRKDLGEFVSTLKDDAAVTIKSAMALREGEEDYDSSYDGSEDDETEGQQWHHQPASAALRAIRADIKTYTEDVPESQSERYSAFLGRFDLGARTKDIATLLKEDPVVTNIHTQLVPEHVTYDDFWTRYFYRAERITEGKAGGGRSFPPEDEDEDEAFGWGEDDQGDDNATKENANDNVQGDNLPSPRTLPATALAHDLSPLSSPHGGAGAPAGGALGAMHPEAAATSDEVAHSLEAVGAGGAGGEVKTLASAAAMAEIARLTAALRACEVERASLVDSLREGSSRGRGNGDDGAKIDELTRQRDAAVAEADELRSALRQVEAEGKETVAKAVADRNAAAAAAEEGQARVAAAEEEIRVHAAARAAAEDRAAAAVAAAADERKEAAEGAVGEGAAAAAEAMAKKASAEVLRLKKAFREERSEHEAMLLASRQAANEAVEAALASADADREQACAELEASMKAEVERKDEELEALRAQLAKSEGAMQEVSTLRADVEDIRRAAARDRESAERGASEARQEADVIRQLREEIRVLQAAASRPHPPAAVGTRGATTTTSRGGRANHNVRSDISGGGEDTDGWGEDVDSCAASTNTNSSGVVVDRPRSATSPSGDDETLLSHGASLDQGTGRGASGSAVGDGDEDSLSPGGGRSHREREGEGDDGWEGWD